MEWLIYALIGQFLIAFAIIFFKIISTKIVKNNLVYFCYVGIISFILAAILIPFIKFSLPNKPQLIFSFFTSVVFAIGIYFIIKSYSLVEASRISIITQLLPVFVLILATIFLDEILTSAQYIGFFIIFIGSVVAAYTPHIISKKNKSILWYLMGIIFFMSLYTVLAKHTYSIYGFWSTFILVRFFVLLYSIIIIVYLIESNQFILKKILTKGTLFLGLNETLALIAITFSQYALSIGKASLVTVVRGTGTIFVLILATIFSIKFPKLLKEELSKKIIGQKIIAIFFIIIGLVFLSL